MIYDLEKKVAISAVIDAAKVCQKVREDIPSAIQKEDKSPVTVADFGAQAVICKALKDIFPHDMIVGEEDATVLRQSDQVDIINKVTDYVNFVLPNATPDQVLDWIDYGNGKVSKRFWTLDPIDGTKGFLRQDQYAIALALIDDGEVKLGIMGCPALYLSEGDMGWLFIAIKNQGAYKMPLQGGDFTKLQVVNNDDIAHFRFVESVETNHGDQEKQRLIIKKIGITTESVRVDSQAKYSIVASGEAALYLRLPSLKYPDYRENIWDHAPGAIIVEEAGGKVTDMYGKSLDFISNIKMNDNRGIVVTNGNIHDLVLAAIND